MDGGSLDDLERRLSGDLTSLDGFARQLAQFGHGRMFDPAIRERPGDAALGVPAVAGIPGRLNADPTTAEPGLAKLVLTLIEPLRRPLEHQALHRIDAGSLTDDETERTSATILDLERRMQELAATCGPADGDRSLNLGPLRDLLQDA